MCVVHIMCFVQKTTRIISQPPLDRSIGNEAKEYAAVVAAEGI
jgi:hypothetical protein